MIKTEKLQRCMGCRNNYYNGHNQQGVMECWSLKSARLVKRVPVGLWERPPWREGEVKVLDCYHESGPSRTLYLPLAQVRENNRRYQESMALTALGATYEA